MGSSPVERSIGLNGGVDGVVLGGGGGIRREWEAMRMEWSNLRTSASH